MLFVTKYDESYMASRYHGGERSRSYATSLDVYFAYSSLAALLHDRILH